MRGSLGRLGCNSNCTKKILISSSGFSTFAGGGGRGRGRGSSGPPKVQFADQAPGKPDDEDAIGEADDAFFPSGLGRGRGKPIPSSPILPSFSSWMSGANSSAGRGRTTQQPDSRSEESQTVQSKKPIFFRREESLESAQKTQLGDSYRNPEEGILPPSLSAGLPGAGRGKTVKISGPEEKPTEENRHIRRRQAGDGPRRAGGIVQQQRSYPSPLKLSREEAVKNAVRILSRGAGDQMEDGGRGRGFYGRGGRGRGGGRGGRGRGGGRGGRGRFHDSEDDFSTGLYLGDNADGERLANSIGAENMDKLVEGFEEMSSRVLPSPMDEAYLDALHTNNLIEYEPEYLMGDFERNPDIDDTPPIPLRDALEKMKPFLMAYEGIQNQEEWEEIIKEVMEKLPYMKELIDIYSGPDTVTAKQQQQELERVAKTLPVKVPNSVKKFTNRAVLSLQSNPGWGFDKKCQFMDKLVWEVSQHYK